MWSKISNALSMSIKSVPPIKDDNSQSEPTVMTKVFEQHPNLSMFHPSESGNIQQQPGTPSSPSVHSKPNMFKRMSKSALKEDMESQRAASPSPFKLTSTISKKKNGHISNSSANGKRWDTCQITPWLNPLQQVHNCHLVQQRADPPRNCFVENL